VGLGRAWNEHARPDSIRTVAREITVSDERFDVGASLEVVVCRFARALSRFMVSCLTRALRLKAVSVVFLSHDHVL
jgi:hypothetical protein